VRRAGGARHVEGAHPRHGWAAQGGGAVESGGGGRGCYSSCTGKLGTLFVSVKYVLVSVKLVCVYVKLLKT
jgi:hypothetical protein